MTSARATFLGVAVLTSSLAAAPWAAAHPTDVPRPAESRALPQPSLEQELVSASGIVVRMEQIPSAIHRLLARARSGRDAARTRWLDETLSQVDSAVRSAREHLTVLRSAVLRNDTPLANHSFFLLGVLHDRVEQLEAEALRAFVPATSITQRTVVIVVVDPELPGEDSAAYPPGAQGPVVEAVACVSCPSR